MKIAILDCFDPNYSEIFDLTSRSKTRYCEKIGMDFLAFNFHLQDRTQHWGRILGMKKHLSDYDYLIYLDTDTIIVDFEFDLRGLITANPDCDLITGPLPTQGHIGTNGMILKNDPWVHDFLDHWYAQDRFVRGPYHGSPSCGIHDDGGFDAPPEQWIFYEQSAFHYLYDSDQEARRRTRLVPRKYMHSVPSTFSRGDFLIHFPGFSKEKKLRLIRSFRVLS
jgi:hypothetical protein